MQPTLLIISACELGSGPPKPRTRTIAPRLTLFLGRHLVASKYISGIEARLHASTNNDNGLESEPANDQNGCYGAERRQDDSGNHHVRGES